MWVNCRFGVCFLFLTMVSQIAIASGYEIPVTRNNQTIKRVAYNAWFSEYPNPVINVFSKTHGTTTVMAFETLRNPVKKIPCTIKNGLYHPWADNNSAFVYYTLTAFATYKAIKQTILENTSIPKGAIINHVHGLSEGYCAGTVSSQQKTRAIVFFCGDIESPAFKKTKSQDEFHEQWIYLKCQEGYKAFIEDKALLAHSGVVTGKVVQYGEVAP